MEILCWLLIAAIFIVVELVSLGLTTIWFAGGAFIAAIVAALGANVIVQILCFIAFSLVLLFFTRPVAIKYLDSKTEKTNAEALVGQNAVVISEINNAESTGQAKVNGMEWTARARDDAIVIPKGESVRIVEIQGVKLIVETINKEASQNE